MDQFNQNASNDLQRAIDEISNGSDAPNLGEPPVPPTNDFGMPPMDGAEVNPPEPPADPIPAQEPNQFTQDPISQPSTFSGDLSSLRESALKELVPIIDKAGLSPDRQFGIVIAVIESTHDKNFVEKALEAARNIPDERLRAEALLKIVSIIDN